jgi:ribosome-binding protein aMBF1 (putative translation factor)
MICEKMKDIRMQREDLAGKIDENKEMIANIEMDIGLIKVQVLNLEQIY